MPPAVSIKQSWQKLQSNQKIGVIFLGAGVLFVSALSFFVLREGLYSPFRSSIEELGVKKHLLDDPIAKQAEYEQRIDTDGDGLSDWSETHVYRSSPYLWSTAGDGIPDNVKLARGENPNCKAGVPCSVTPLRYDLPDSNVPFTDFVQRDVQGEVNQYLYGNEPGALGWQQQAEEYGYDTDLRSQIPRDPAILRQSLLESGKVTEEDLEGISDERLLQLFDEAVDELEAQQGTFVPESSTVTEE